MNGASGAEPEKTAPVLEETSMQDDDDVCIVLAERINGVDKHAKKLAKQISIMQAFNGEGSTSSRPVVEFKPRLQPGPKKFFVSPPAYIQRSQKKRLERKRKQGEKAQPDRLGGKYMHWDNLVVAMVLEKAKQLNPRGGFSISKSIKWFQRQFPQIENFQRLRESTVRAWRQNGIYRKIRGRKAVDEERKTLIRSWLNDIIRPKEVHVPSTINSIWSVVQAK